jgi:hypothetical protein
VCPTGYQFSAAHGCDLPVDVLVLERIQELAAHHANQALGAEPIDRDAILLIEL